MVLSSSGGLNRTRPSVWHYTRFYYFYMHQCCLYDAFTRFTGGMCLRIKAGCDSVKMQRTKRAQCQYPGNSVIENMLFLWILIQISALIKPSHYLQFAFNSISHPVLDPLQRTGKMAVGSLETARFLTEWLPVTF